MYFLNYSGAFYGDELGRLINNNWLIGQYDDIVHLPKYILLCPFGFTGNVLNVGWMLGYIYWGNVMGTLLWIVTRKMKIASKIALLIILIILLFSVGHFLFYYCNVLFAYCLSRLDNRIMLLESKKKWGCTMIIFSIFLMMEFYVSNSMTNMIRAMLFLVAVYLNADLKGFLSNSFFSFLGRISLGIYVLQLIVIYTITCRLATLDFFQTYKSINILISFIVIVFVAWLYTNYMEPIFKTLTKRTLGMLNLKPKGHYFGKRPK
jgi:peptidoglycan/LPS O-acetylase OafA/YrhL